jgi:hypothetical protein
MNEQKHSPLPFAECGRNVIAADHAVVCSMNCPAMWARDQEFIIRACNSHEEFLEACIEALYWLDVDSPGAEAAAKKLDAAIAKAEGK